MLKRNVGGLDRCARLALGIVLVPVGLWLLGGIRGQLSGLVVATLGLVALATGLLGFCLLYAPLGISTADGVSLAGCPTVGCCGRTRETDVRGETTSAVQEAHP